MRSVAHSGIIRDTNIPAFSSSRERSRGLRLYAAWTQKTKAIPIWETPENLPLPIDRAFHDSEGCRLTAVGRQSQLRATTANLSLAGVDSR